MNYLLDIDLTETDIKAAISDYIGKRMGIYNITIEHIKLSHHTSTSRDPFSMTGETRYSANVRINKE